MSSGIAAPYPMNEPNVPTYSSDITHVCGLPAALSWSAIGDFALTRLSMQNHAPAAARSDSGTHTSAMFSRLTALAAPKTEIPTIAGTTSCTVETPMLPPAALMPSAAPFFASG